ncbi:FAD-dependent oxidoreductase [Escherichia coli]|nr:FAD-dependent oxidoreductase [Escherichia coli]EGO4102462.1 FAD-dependent oxidoreductase [Escherichia coli]EGO4104809.1 FAD-dependent oxidoreductase [Escherichia coli]EGO4714285.1 FAD-dependent oxidoreductase [Escherichia coli]
MKTFGTLLIGAGHAHLEVLRHWVDVGAPFGDVALLSPSPDAWYSGMLPGLLAGRYQSEQCRIPLSPLCLAAGVTLMQGKMIALDAQTGRVSLEDGRLLQGECVSLNTGAALRSPHNLSSVMDVLPVKPFADFLIRLAHWQRHPGSLAIIGGGAAGVELALAMSNQTPSLTLFCSDMLLGSHAPGVRQRAHNHLKRAGVQVQEHCPIDAIQGNGLLSGQQIVWEGNRVLLASGPAPASWWQSSGLSCDDRGFIQITTTLQSASHPHVFATGDCATLPDTPKSGVYAVRQGAVLEENLRRAARQESLRPFRPQSRAVALLADGQGGAIMSWAGLSAEGKWAGVWKDILDRRFIQRHSL